MLVLTVTEKLHPIGKGTAECIRCLKVKGVGGVEIMQTGRFPDRYYRPGWIDGVESLPTRTRHTTLSTRQWSRTLDTGGIRI
jgi:hypothetical protein